MEITLLAVCLAAQIFMLIFAYAHRGFMLFLFSGIIGFVPILSLVSNNAEIEYVSNGALVSVSSGGFFLLIPALLTIISFFGMISMRSD